MLNDAHVHKLETSSERISVSCVPSVRHYGSALGGLGWSLFIKEISNQTIECLQRKQKQSEKYAKLRSQLAN